MNVRVCVCVCAHVRLRGMSVFNLMETATAITVVHVFRYISHIVTYFSCRLLHILLCASTPAPHVAYPHPTRVAIYHEDVPGVLHRISWNVATTGRPLRQLVCSRARPAPVCQSESCLRLITLYDSAPRSSARISCVLLPAWKRLQTVKISQTVCPEHLRYHFSHTLSSAHKELCVLRYVA